MFYIKYKLCARRFKGTVTGLFAIEYAARQNSLDRCATRLFYGQWSSALVYTSRVQADGAMRNSSALICALLTDDPRFD